MILRVFAIYDSKAKAFMLPFCLSTPGQAVREFTNLAQDKQTVIGRNPVDFTLFEIGLYDDQSGELAPSKEHVNYGLASQLLED